MSSLVDRLVAVVRGVRQMPLAVHVLSLVVAGLAIAPKALRQWFFFDEWDPIAVRDVSGSGGKMSWLSPHNEHPFTLGTLWYRSMLHFFGLRTYAPYVLTVLVLHLFLTHLLWRVMRKLGADPMVCSVVAALFALGGFANENLFWAFQVAFVSSIVFGVWAILVSPDRGPIQPKDGLAGLFAFLSVQWAGVGLTMVAVLALWSAWRRRWSAAVLVSAVSLGPYLLWVKLYASKQVSGGETLQQGLTDLGAYVWSGLTTATGEFVGWRDFGPVVVLVVATGVAWLCSGADRRVDRASLMAFGAVIFLGLVSLRRSTLGIDQAGSSRYTHVVMALLVPVVGLVISRLVRRVPGSSVVLLVLAVLALSGQYRTLANQGNSWAVRADAGKTRVLAATVLIRSGEPLVASAQVDPEWAPELMVSEAQRLEKLGQLPVARVSDDDLAAARNRIQVAFNQDGEGKASSGSVQLLSASKAYQLANGCVVPDITGEFVMELEVVSPAALDIQVAAPTGLQVSTASSITKAWSPNRSFEIAGDTSANLELLGAGTHVRVAFGEGRAAQLCGAISVAPADAD